MDREAETDPRESTLASAALILATSFYCLMESQLVDNWVFYYKWFLVTVFKNHISCSAFWTTT